LDGGFADAEQVGDTTPNLEIILFTDHQAGEFAC
jgi:hypothetical protein